ncbi:MAG TPA: hypothetical protein VGG48_06475 [Rhizomicrobium sp.]|jgi:tetratricopeptide (TPR) repeat protein
MKPIVFALVIGAVIFTAGPAAATHAYFGSAGDVRTHLAAGKCADENLAPVERVKNCEIYANSGPSGGYDGDMRVVLLARANRLAGNYVEAENILTAKLSLYPKNRALLSERANAYVGDGKFDLAMADANLAVATNPDEYFAFNNRCWIRAVAGKELDAALNDCNKAIAMHDTNANLVDSLAFVYYKCGDLKTALEKYNDALGLDSHQWSSLYMRGVVRRAMGDIAGGNEDIANARRRSNYIVEEFTGYGVKAPQQMAATP